MGMQSHVFVWKLFENIPEHTILSTPYATVPITKIILRREANLYADDDRSKFKEVYWEEAKKLILLIENLFLLERGTHYSSQSTLSYL